MALFLYCLHLGCFCFPFFASVCCNLGSGHSSTFSVERGFSVLSINEPRLFGTYPSAAPEWPWDLQLWPQTWESPEAPQNQPKGGVCWLLFCDKLWQAVTGCGRPWQAMEGCWRSFQAVAGCGRPWQAVEGCGRLRKAVRGCGRLGLSFLSTDEGTEILEVHWGLLTGQWQNSFLIFGFWTWLSQSLCQIMSPYTVAQLPHFKQVKIYGPLH